MHFPQNLRLMTAGVLACALAACSDASDTLLDPAAPSASAGVQQVPTRASEKNNTFVHMADDALWRRIERAQGLAFVGLKAPGQNRGVWGGSILVSPQQKQQGVAAIEALGATVLDRHDRFPMLRLRVDDAATFRKLRQLPFVDYVEPAVIREGVSWEGGCSLDPYTGQTMYSASGDILPLHFRGMQIDRAWYRSSGAGITVGLVDTGIYGSSQQMASGFLGGQSWNRAVRYDYTSSYGTGLIGDGDCSHGTRMAGVIAAPRDGTGPAGVAWGANLVSVRHNDDVVAFDTWSAMTGIDRSATYSHITAIAWGSHEVMNGIADAIRYWHNYYGRMFIGAAGTQPTCAVWADAISSFPDVIFPAELAEVVAVTAIDDQGKIACDVHTGGEVQFVTPYNYPSPGPGSQVVGIRGSSSSTAVVAGIAALVWSKYNTNRDDVLNRMRQAASRWGNRSGTHGYGVINAMRAVGGMYNASLSGCTSENGCQFHYKISGCQDHTYSLSPVGGDGPYTYENGFVNAGSYGVRTVRLCSDPGRTATYNVGGTVRDSDGSGIYRSISISVTDPDAPCPTCPQ